MKHRWIGITGVAALVGALFGLSSILDERSDRALPAKVDGLISKMTVETLNLRPDMLVNVTPAR